VWLSLDDALGPATGTLREQSMPLGTLGSAQSGWSKATWPPVEESLILLTHSLEVLSRLASQSQLPNVG
jgi:hypothetical protein